MTKGSEPGRTKEPCPTCGCTRTHNQPWGLDVHRITRVREWRLKRGLSMVKLADRANIGKNTVYLLENGYGNARIETIRLLAEALGIEPNDLR